MTAMIEMSYRLAKHGAFGGAWQSALTSRPLTTRTTLRPMKPKLNLRQVEAFRAVMQSGTIVAAAEVLSVTQPAVSRLISQMELRLGFQLFERRGRRLQPTHQGEQLFREVERVYLGVERIAQAAVDIKHHRTGELRIACLPALSTWILPRAIRRFHTQHPGTYIFINSLPSRQICDQVATHDFDLGIVELPVRDSGVRVLPIESQPVVLLVPQTHRLAGSQRLSIKALAPEPLILLSQHSALRKLLEQAFHQLDIEPNIKFETPHSLVACALVREGLGLTIVSRETAQQFEGQGVQIIALEEKVTSEEGIILPKIGIQNPLTELFVTCLRAEFQAHWIAA